MGREGPGPSVPPGGLEVLGPGPQASEHPTCGTCRPRTEVSKRTWDATLQVAKGAAEGVSQAVSEASPARLRSNILFHRIFLLLSELLDTT